MRECCTVCSERYLVFSSITLPLNGNRMLSFWHSLWGIKQLLPVIFGAPPQAILHTEEEDSCTVGDCQPMWPPHRVELGCPHHEGQTPKEHAVWVDSKPTICNFKHSLYPADHHNIWESKDNLFDIIFTITGRDLGKQRLLILLNFVLAEDSFLNFLEQLYWNWSTS